jgi:hypothetical protein
VRQFILIQSKCFGQTFSLMVLAKRGVKMKAEAISSALIKMVNNKNLRKLLVKKIDGYVYKNMVNDDSEDLQQVRLKRYQFLSAMLHCVVRNVDKGYVSGDVIKKIIDVFVQYTLIGGDESYDRAVEKFKEKYGEPPPSFIVFSPTQKCNLNCIGCYASSTSKTAATIPYSYVDRVIGEVHDSFGSRFITISGGEPFMYKSEDKTLLDVFQKYILMAHLLTKKLLKDLPKGGMPHPQSQLKVMKKKPTREEVREHTKKSSRPLNV